MATGQKANQQSLDSDRCKDSDLGFLLAIILAAGLEKKISPWLKARFNPLNLSAFNDLRAGEIVAHWVRTNNHLVHTSKKRPKRFPLHGPTRPVRWSSGAHDGEAASGTSRSYLEGNGNVSVQGISAPCWTAIFFSGPGRGSCLRERTLLLRDHRDQKNVAAGPHHERKLCHSVHGDHRGDVFANLEERVTGWKGRKLL